MRTALYVIWFLIPAFFFLMALWSLLERWSGRPKKENSEDFAKQGAFVLVCVVACVLLDQYAIEAFHREFLQGLVPLGFLQVILLPVVFFIGAKLIGPSQEIRISKAPHPSEKKGTSRSKSGSKK